MIGQLSIFDLGETGRPCDYRFQRYIGQEVEDRHGRHIIAEIQPYYTIYTDRMVGTPHDMHTVESEEE